MKKFTLAVAFALTCLTVNASLWADTESGVCGDEDYTMADGSQCANKVAPDNTAAYYFNTWQETCCGNKKYPITCTSPYALCPL